MEWRRGHVIGRGSSATVSAATSASSGDLFAVKSVELSLSRALQREVKILSNLRSPHIVGYIGNDITNEADKLVYNLLMEYVPGGTLTDAICKHGTGLDESAIGHYTRQILLGVEYIHSIGVVHCDIKGQNILIGESGAKIADFGCAKWLYHRDDVAMVPIGGTPMFMAPEVARGEDQGFPADIWALGCTVIEMATGTSPWPDCTDPVSILYKIAFSGELPEIPDFLSFQARDFLGKCLRRDPEERWTAKQLLNHPFLVESNNLEQQIPGWNSNSPTSILDQDVWHSTSESESLCSVCLIGGGDSPPNRIRRLGSFTPGPTRTSENDWITIRTRVDELAHCVSGEELMDWR